MTTKYYALLTEIGAAKLANATALGTKLQITQMAVGDGGGTLPTPGAKQTALIGEKRRAPLNSLSVDPVNSSQIVAEQIIPESEGGYWIREIGLFDADNALIAVANCAETYKPQLQEGSGRTQTVRMILIVSSTEAVTLKIDPSVVLATRKYVDDKVIEVKAYMDAGLAGKMDKVKNGADIANPDAFVANLGLGSAEGRLRAGFFPASVNSIPEGVNLNNMTFPGAYFQAANANSKTSLNYPVEGRCGNLNVYRNAANGTDGCIQEFSLYNTADTYKRLYYAVDKTWSAWKKVMTEDLLGNVAKRNIGTGLNQIPDMNFFNSTFGGNGYQKIPGGFIIQWGTFDVQPTKGAVSSIDITYPIPFDYNFSIVNAFYSTQDPSQRYVGFDAGNSNKHKARFTYVTPTVNGIYWFAVGR